MTQAPTPGPLSGDDVNRECKACGAFKAERDAACTFCGLAPTAPVEASGSERDGPEVGEDAVAKILAPYLPTINSTPDLLSILYDADLMPEQTVTVRGAICVAAVCEAYKAALRPQGEAAAWIDPSDLEHVAEGHPLTTTLFPYAKDGATMPLYTTPARAEAQDEGAAGEPWGYATRRVRIDGSACEGPWKPGKIGDGFYMMTVDDPDWETVTLYAHPSPTPAADADRVREAVTIIRDRLRQIWEGDTHLVYSGNPPEPSHDEEGDLAKLANEAVEALNSVFPVPDALKSEGK